MAASWRRQISNLVSVGSDAAEVAAAAQDVAGCGSLHDVYDSAVRAAECYDY